MQRERKKTIDVRKDFTTFTVSSRMLHILDSLSFYVVPLRPAVLLGRLAQSRSVYSSVYLLRLRNQPPGGQRCHSARVGHHTIGLSTSSRKSFRTSGA